MALPCMESILGDNATSHMNEPVSSFVSEAISINYWRSETDAVISHESQSAVFRKARNDVNESSTSGLWYGIFNLIRTKKMDKLIYVYNLISIMF